MLGRFVNDELETMWKKAIVVYLSDRGVFERSWCI
jgi:hypothetical protein